MRSTANRVLREASPVLRPALGGDAGDREQESEDLRAYARKYVVGKPRIVGVLIDPEARKAIKLTEADLLPRSVQ